MPSFRLMAAYGHVAALACHPTLTWHAVTLQIWLHGSMSHFNYVACFRLMVRLQLVIPVCSSQTSLLPRGCTSPSPENTPCADSNKLGVWRNPPYMYTHTFVYNAEDWRMKAENRGKSGPRQVHLQGLLG